MPGMTNFLSTELLDHVNNKGAYTAPANIFLALYENTKGPTDAGGGTELSGGSYARISTAAADWDAATNGVADNAVDLSFAEATADWAAAGHAGRFDASTAGNLLEYGNLAVAKTILTGDTGVFRAGEFIVNYNSNN